MAAKRSLVVFVLVAFTTAGCQWAQTGGARVDSRLASMIPAGTIALAGIRMDEVRATQIYQKMLAAQRLTQFDDLTAQTGFDPRKDVRDLLIASNGKDNSLLLARGTFHLRPSPGVQQTTYHGFAMWSKQDSGVGVIDESTAVAGKLAAVRAALDQYKSGGSAVDPELMTRARAIGSEYQMWSVAKGFGGLLDRALPQSGNSVNAGRILESLENSSGALDLRSGIKGYLTGQCRTDQDAKNLGDAARGLVGMGRLSVPENQPQMLRLWDGIKVDQQQRIVRINIAIPQDLVDKLSDMFDGGRPMRQ